MGIMICTSHLVVGDSTIKRVDRPANKGERFKLKISIQRKTCKVT